MITIDYNNNFWDSNTDLNEFVKYAERSFFSMKYSDAKYSTITQDSN